MVETLFNLVKREGRRFILRPSRARIRREHPVAIYLKKNGPGWYLVRFKPKYIFNPKNNTVTATKRVSPNPELEARVIDGRYDGKQEVTSFILQVFGKETSIAYSNVESIGYNGSLPLLNTDYIDRTLARMPKKLKIQEY